VARRKYRSEAISQAGQQERPRDPTGDESLALPLSPRGEYGKPEPDGAAQPSPHFATGLGDQLRQQQQYAQADPLDHYIAQAFPGAMPHERQWLRMNAHHLRDPALVNHAAAIALQRGIPRHSPEFLHFVGQLLDQHAAAQAQAPAPAPAMPPPPMPVHTQIDIEKTESPEGEPESASVAVHHMSAPVSRGDYSHAIEPDLSPSQIRLTAEEREAAHAAGVSEIEYGKQKLKMMKLKKAKLIE
jgi:hypothetical protein